MDLKMTLEDLRGFLDQVFPQVAQDFILDEVEPGRIALRLRITDKHLRPGGTVSGPSMFALADVSAYLVTLAMIGPKALAVTTNCSIDFMRKPVAGVDLKADARLLKLGRSLSVADVMIHSVGEARPVARASLTYSIPPAGSAADRA